MFIYKCELDNREASCTYRRVFKICKNFQETDNLPQCVVELNKKCNYKKSINIELK